MVCCILICNLMISHAAGGQFRLLMMVEAHHMLILWIQECSFLAWSVQFFRSLISVHHFNHFCPFWKQRKKHRKEKKSIKTEGNCFSSDKFIAALFWKGKIDDYSVQIPNISRLHWHVWMVCIWLCCSQHFFESKIQKAQGQFMDYSGC